MLPSIFCILSHGVCAISVKKTSPAWSKYKRFTQLRCCTLDLCHRKQGRVTIWPKASLIILVPHTCRQCGYSIERCCLLFVHFVLWTPQKCYHQLKSAALNSANIFFPRLAPRFEGNCSKQWKVCKMRPVPQKWCSNIIEYNWTASFYK